MITTSQRYSHAYIEALPNEILTFCLGELAGAELKNTLLINKRWFFLLKKEYGKEGLQKLVQSDVSGNSIKLLWKNQKRILESCGEKIISSKEFIVFYLSAREFFLKYGFYNKTGAFYENKSHEKKQLLTSGVTELPQGIHPSYEVLELSIDIDNIRLCRSILSKASSEAKEQWQNRCLFKLIEKAEKSDSWNKLTFEWIENFLPHSIIQFHYKSGFARPLSMLHVSLLRSKKISEILIEAAYKEIKPFDVSEDLKKTISILFLLSRTEREPHKAKWCEQKFHQLFSTLNEKQKMSLLDYFKNWDEELLLKEILQTATNAHIPEGFFDIVINQKQKTVMQEAFYVPLDPLNPTYDDTFVDNNNCDKNKSIAQIYLESMISNLEALVKQNDSMIEVQFFFVLLQGNRDRMEWVITHYNFTPSRRNFEWVIETLSILKLNKEESAILDENLHYLLKKFSNLEKNIELQSLIRLVTLDLPKTFKCIASTHQHKELWPYILRRLNKKNHSFTSHVKKILKNEHALFQEEPTKAFVLKSIKVGKFSSIYPLHQYSDECIKHQVREVLLMELELFNKNLLTFILDKQLLSLFLVSQILFESKECPPAGWKKECQLIALNRLAQEHMPLKGEEKKLYDKYLEIIMSDIQATSFLSADFIKNLYQFIHELFYFQKYPALVSAMDAEKQNELIESLFSKLIEAVELIVPLSQAGRVNETGIDFGSVASRDLFIRYEQEYLSLTNDRVTPIKLYIAGFQMFFSLGVGLKFAELIADQLIYQQLSQQIFELKKESSFYEILRGVCKQGSLLLEEHKRAIPHRIISSIETKQYLVKNLLERESAVKKEESFPRQSYSAIR